MPRAHRRVRENAQQFPPSGPPQTIRGSDQRVRRFATEWRTQLGLAVRAALPLARTSRD